MTLLFLRLEVILKNCEIDMIELFVSRNEQYIRQDFLIGTRRQHQNTEDNTEDE